MNHQIARELRDLNNKLAPLRLRADETNARLARIERLLYRGFQLIHEDEMASKATDDRAIAAITVNTNATKAATMALTGFVTSTAELTQALKDALANADAADDPEVLAAVQALEQNNADLAAATPAVATAITANTPAA